FPSTVAGNIALIERGTLSFADKVTNAMNAGASAAIIYNNDVGDFIGTLGTSTTKDGRQWVPTVSVSDETGRTLKMQALSGTVGTVVDQISNRDTYSGTSMATPHAAGVIALIWSVDLTMPNTTVQDVLFSTCKDLGNPGYDTNFGYGLVDASAAL